MDVKYFTFVPMNFQLSTREEYDLAYAQSVSNPEAFWNVIAEQYQWRKKWDRTLAWNFDEPNVQWFIGGQLNITENCLDRHIATKGDETALIWEANDPKEISKTYTWKSKTLPATNSKLKNLRISN